MADADLASMDASILRAGMPGTHCDLAMHFLASGGRVLSSRGK